MSEFERSETSFVTIPDSLPLMAAMIGINNCEGLVWIDAVHPVAKNIVDHYRKYSVHEHDDGRVIFSSDCFEQIVEAMDYEKLKMIATEWSFDN